MCVCVCVCVCDGDGDGDGDDVGKRVWETGMEMGGNASGIGGHGGVGLVSEGRRRMWLLCVRLCVCLVCV